MTEKSADVLGGFLSEILGQHEGLLAIVVADRDGVPVVKVIIYFV